MSLALASFDTVVSMKPCPEFESPVTLQTKSVHLSQRMKKNMSKYFRISKKSVTRGDGKHKIKVSGDHPFSCFYLSRYVAVCHPHTFRQAQMGGGRGRVSLATCLVFLAAVLINVPKVPRTNQEADRTDSGQVTMEQHKDPTKTN